MSRKLSVVSTSTSTDYRDWDGVVWPCFRGRLPEKLPGKIRHAVDSMIRRAEFKFDPGKCLAFDLSPELRGVVVAMPPEGGMFEILTTARQALEPLLGVCQDIVVDLRAYAGDHTMAVDAFSSALVVGRYRFEKYGQRGKAKAIKDTLQFLTRDGEAALSKIALSAEMQAEGTNLVRDLTLRAANDLDCRTYRREVAAMAKKLGWRHAFWGEPQLKKLGAGAFLAVSQGSAHRDAGIVKLTYTPSSKGRMRKVVLVGKGITFDTGGSNLKSASGMFGMHGDMAGSAVALAVLQLATREQWPWEVSAYLAIADNAIGSRAYRPNEVVTSLAGKTIETVHTDAEGRMVLADTLALAARESPEIIINLATLTGACVRSIGTGYAGIFSNRGDQWERLLRVGMNSGERVWPFPMPSDYGDCLKSDIADLKQCRLTGGVDHIEAAIFLKNFVPADIPWYHVDISPAARTEALAHVPGEINGFGVRLLRSLVHECMNA